MVSGPVLCRCSDVSWSLCTPPLVPMFSGLSRLERCALQVLGNTRLAAMYVENHSVGRAIENPGRVAGADVFFTDLRIAGCEGIYATRILLDLNGLGGLGA